MAGLHIALLGGLEIAGGEAMARTSLTRKAKALVAYLALQGGRGQSREKLSELLWSDSAVHSSALIMSTRGDRACGGDSIKLTAMTRYAKALTPYSTIKSIFPMQGHGGHDNPGGRRA